MSGLYYSRVLQGKREYHDEVSSERGWGERGSAQRGSAKKRGVRIRGRREDELVLLNIHESFLRVK